MSHLKVKPMVACILGLSIAIWATLLYTAGIDFGLSWNSVKKLPAVLSYVMIIWGVFIKWGWKWKIFRGWLVPFPNLEGTWRGTYTSTWVDPATGTTPPDGEIVLVIRQNFLTLHCTVYTKELTSRSYTAAFHFDGQSGVRKLVYVYMADPKQAVRHRSQLHRGAAELDIIGSAPSELNGVYWTDRKSTGDLRLRFVSASKAESFGPSANQVAS